MDSEKQKDEIEALESIYTSEEFSYNETNSQYECTLKIFINFCEGYFLTYKDTRHKETPEEKVLISRLPPLTLFVKLPEDYPSKSPPEFTLCCSWLRQLVLTKLCKKLDDLWLEYKNQEVLYTWASFLQHETLEFLGIQEGLNINYAYTFYKVSLETGKGKKVEKEDGNEASGVSVRGDSVTKVSKNEMIQKKQYRKQRNKRIIDKRAIVDRPSEQNPVQFFLDYNEKRLSIEFKKNFYSCKICFLDKSGESCTQFKPCLHVFCKECIGGFLEVRIKDGAVKDICCPEEKCRSEATPGQIKDLVSTELFAKYDSTLLMATLDTMLDIVYCPRRHCQYPVSKEPDEKMASCPSCQYTFCVFCKMVYHGVEPCKVNLADKKLFVDQYLNASQEKKLELEKRYGKKQLQTIIENSMSENWITSNSHNCPQCNTAIEKSDGCNKMTCGRCQTYFCWVCGDRLDREKPYLHYENPQSKCYLMLYYGLIEDEDEEDEEDDNDFFVFQNFSDSSDDDYLMDLDL